MNLEIECQQFIDTDGKVIADLPAPYDNPEVLIELYRRMTWLRHFDQKVIALQRTGKMGTYPASAGQEAFSVGIGHAMRESDVFCPYYRDQGTMLARGVKPEEILLYWGGDERGSCYQDQSEDLPVCVPIASQYLHAAGVAYAFKLREQQRAVVTTIGDGGTSKGDFYEAINFAAIYDLPVVFMINNNQWAISVPRESQCAAPTLAQKAMAAGMPGIQVDGNDVVAVANAVSTALANADQGQGPCLIEAMTYRLCDHTTADDATRYQDPETVKAAWLKEPLVRMRHYLAEHASWNDQKQAELDAQCKAEIATAVDNYQQVQADHPTSMFDALYAELPAAFSSQREELNA